MPRIIPQYRKRLMFELMRLIRKSKGLGPNYIRAVDRLMFLDRLATGTQLKEFTKPYEQLHKEAEVVEGDVNTTDLEDKKLLDDFNARHYGRGNVRTDSTNTGDGAGEHTDTPGEPS